jgi:hypothetical protein
MTDDVNGVALAACALCFLAVTISGSLAWL